MANAVILLANASATGNPAALPRDVYTFAVAGTFGGATVSLEMLSPIGGTDYIAIDSTSFTAKGAINVELPSGRFRAAISGGAGTSITATLLAAGET